MRRNDFIGCGKPFWRIFSVVLSVFLCAGIFPPAAVAAVSSGQSGEALVRVEPAGAIVAERQLIYGEALSAAGLEGAFRTSAAPDSPVDGALAWQDPDTILPAGSHYVGYRFTPSAPGFASASGRIMVTVAPRDLLIVPEEGQRRTYSCSVYPEEPLAFTYHGGYMDDTFPQCLTGALALAAPDAGDQPITRGSLSAGNNYSIRVAPGAYCRVTPLELSGNSGKVVIAPKEYDGTTKAYVQSLTLDGFYKQDRVAARYIAEYRQEAAGMDIPVTVHVVQLKGEDASNYQLPQGAALHATGDILPANQGENHYSLDINLSGAEAGSSLFLGQFLDDILLSQYTHRIRQDSGDNLFASGPTVDDDGFLNYTSQSGLESGVQAVYTITFSSPDSPDIAFTIRFYAGKIRGIVSLEAQPKQYDGQPPQIDTSFTLADTGEPIYFSESQCDYVYTRLDGEDFRRAEDGRPIDAGRYLVTASIDTPDYIGSGSGTLVIEKALLPLTAVSKALSGKTLPAMEYYYGEDDLAPGDVLENILSPAPRLRFGAATVSATGQWQWPIQFANTPVAKNYNVTLESGTLTLARPPDESALLSVSPLPGTGGWHNAPIRVAPHAATVFTQISQTAEGPFRDTILLEAEGDGLSREFYLCHEGLISPPITHTYRLDTTPPVIDSFRSAQSKGQASFTFQATDSLSGVDAVSVTGPGGYTLTPGPDGYPATQSGDYRVAVTDTAGNTAVAVHTITLRSVSSLTITGSDGKPLSASPYPLRALGVQVTGTALPEDYTLTWSSDSPGVVSVDAQGNLDMRGLGSATITVEAMGVTASRRIDSVLSLPVSGEPGLPSVDIPAQPTPSGGALNLRLLVGLPSREDQDLLRDQAAQYSSFAGMDLEFWDIRLYDESSQTVIQPEGPIFVTLPYSQGRDSGMVYAALHYSGETSTLLSVSPLESGVGFSAPGAGLFAMGYRDSVWDDDSYSGIVTGGSGSSTGGGGKSGSGSNSGSAVRDTAPPETYWDSILRQIRDGADGQTIPAELTASRAQVPVGVLQALSGTNLSLRFSDDEGNTVTLTGRDLVGIIFDKTAYSLDQLAVLAPTGPGYEIIPPQEPPAQSAAPGSEAVPKQGGGKTASSQSSEMPEEADAGQSSTGPAPKVLEQTGQLSAFPAGAAGTGPVESPPVTSRGRTVLPLLFLAASLTAVAVLVFRKRFKG